MYVAVGTNLFQEIFLCMNATFFQAITNHTVDFMVALLLADGFNVRGPDRGPLFRQVKR